MARFLGSNTGNMIWLLTQYPINSIYPCSRSQSSNDTWLFHRDHTDPSYLHFRRLRPWYSVADQAIYPYLYLSPTNNRHYIVTGIRRDEQKTASHEDTHPNHILRYRLIHPLTVWTHFRIHPPSVYPHRILTPLLFSTITLSKQQLFICKWNQRKITRSG